MVVMVACRGLTTDRSFVNLAKIVKAGSAPLPRIPIGDSKSEKQERRHLLSSDGWPTWSGTRGRLAVEWVAGISGMRNARLIDIEPQGRAQFWVLHRQALTEDAEMAQTSGEQHAAWRARTGRFCLVG